LLCHSDSARMFAPGHDCFVFPLWQGVPSAKEEERKIEDTVAESESRSESIGKEPLRDDIPEVPAEIGMRKAAE
jgi:hypothetical protein